MRRPFAVIGFSYLAALAVALYVGNFEYLAAAAAVACVISFLFSKPGKTVFLPVILVTSLTAIICAGIYVNIKITPSQKMLGKTVKVSARLCDMPYEKYERYYYKLDADSLTDENGDTVNNTKILVSSDEPIDIELFDRIELTAVFSSSQNTYNTSKGIMLSGSVKANTAKVLREEHKPIIYYFILARDFVSKRVSLLFPKENAGIITAMIIGDKTSLSPDISTSFRKAGISHILAVSGFHISVTSAFILSALMLLTRKRRKISSVLCMLFVLAYMSIAGFTPSVTRAGIMQLIFLSGNFFQRKADPLNSLGIAVLIITIMNPYAVNDAGFLLSFSATLGILVAGGKIQRYLEDLIKPKAFQHKHFKRRLKQLLYALLKGIISVFSVSFSAFLFTIPVMILYFRQIAIYSVLTNILIAPVLSVVIVCVILTLLFSLIGIFSFLTVPMVFAVSLFTGYIIFVARLVSAIPFSLLNVSREFVPVWLIISIAAAIVLYFVRANKNAVKIYSIAVSLTFILMSLLNGIMDMNVIRFSLIDTGNGISFVVVKNNNAYVLSCGGDNGKYRAVNEHLEALNINKLSYLLLINNKRAAVSYAHELLRDFGTYVVEVYNEEQYYENLHSLINQSDNIICRSPISDSYNTTHIGNMEISSNVFKKGGFVYADIDGFRILVCTDGTDCVLIPENFKQCDILIINGTVSNSERIVRSNVFIADRADNSKEYTLLSNDRVYISDGGSLSVKLYNNRYSIRRESVWLS